MRLYSPDITKPTEVNYYWHEKVLIEPMPKPKQGEWIEDYNNTYSRCRMKCSACGKFSGIGGIKSNQRKPYCPNCGARIDERDT